MTEAITQIQKQTPERHKPRERLSDEEMGNLLSSVGNHEAKAVTLILMRSGNIYGRKDLNREVLNSQGNSKGWRMHNTVAFSYCSHSLAPIGLVAMEIINPDLSTYGYAITEKGKDLGIPLAGLLLEFSERHNIPLNLLFGATRSNSKSKIILTKEGEDIEFRKRSPSTTLKILYELLTSPNLPIRETDLVREIGSMPGYLKEHLARLSQLGIIQYSATEANKPFSSYKLATVIPEGEVPIYRSDRTFTKEIFDIFKNHPDQYLTLEDMYNLLSKARKEKRSVSTFRTQISGISSFLAKHKYLNIKRFKNLKESEINITDEQGVVLTELLEIMYKFQSQDNETLERGRRLAGEITLDPNRVSNLLRRAKEASSYANRSPQEKSKEHILSIILSNPNGITNKGIQKLLEKKYDKKLGTAQIGKLSSPLIKSEAVRVGRKGTINIYYPNNEE